MWSQEGVPSPWGRFPPSGSVCSSNTTKYFSFGDFLLLAFHSFLQLYLSASFFFSWLPCYLSVSLCRPLPLHLALSLHPLLFPLLLFAFLSLFPLFSLDSLPPMLLRCCMCSWDFQFSHEGQQRPWRCLWPCNEDELVITSRVTCGILPYISLNHLFSKHAHQLHPFLTGHHLKPFTILVTLLWPCSICQHLS